MKNRMGVKIYLANAVETNNKPLTESGMTGYEGDTSEAKNFTSIANYADAKSFLRRAEDNL